MIRLIQRRLIIPRGDTGTFSVPVLTSYNSGDVAVFSIINPITQSKIYEKIVEVTESVITIKFEHGDTVNLPVGKYLWDIKFYQNPVIVDGELVNGTEIDSYYAAFTMPVCEIRQTGDSLMTADDAPGSTLTPQQLNAINAALLALKDAVEKTEANVEHYPTIIDGVWNVWDANLGDYTSTGVEATGNGIASIEKTNTEGLVDTYTVNFTNGTTFIYNVTNGSDNYTLTAADKQEIAAAAIQLMNKTLTVTVLTQDNVTVTGQTVTVRADNAEGEIYATAAYEGQPVSFSLPTGFQYFVSVSDTLTNHFNPTTARGIIKDTNAAVTLQYRDLSTIHTAPDIKAALNAGMDLTDLVGEQITCTKNGETLTWDVVDYDDTNKRITLLLHSGLEISRIVFEPDQVLMWCEGGLAAGSYTFKDGNNQYYFTTSVAIPAGGQLLADNIQYVIYQSQSSTTASHIGTVSTTAIDGAIDLGICGQGLLNAFRRIKNGSNNIAESALFWWLNTDAAANTYRPLITKFQRPYSYSVPGFMNGLDTDFIDCVDEAEWKCNTNNVYECPKALGGLTDGPGRSYTIKGKFCLASEMEIFGSYDGYQDGSTVYDLYNGATAVDRMKHGTSVAQTWWLRSPHQDYADNEMLVHISGEAGYYDAASGCYVAPACQISRDKTA